MNWAYNPEHNSLDADWTVPWSKRPLRLMVEQESVPDEDEPAYITEGQAAAVDHLHAHAEAIRELLLQTFMEALEAADSEYEEDDGEEAPDWWGEDEDDAEDDDAVRPADHFALSCVKVHIEVHRGVADLTFEGTYKLENDREVLLHYSPGDDAMTLELGPVRI